jgi:hypothetical protein
VAQDEVVAWPWGPPPWGIPQSGNLKAHSSASLLQTDVFWCGGVFLPCVGGVSEWARRAGGLFGRKEAKHRFQREEMERWLTRAASPCSTPTSTKALCPAAACR